MNQGHWRHGGSGGGCPRCPDGAGAALDFSPVNLEFDLEQIATEMIFAGSNSLNSAS